MEDDCTWRTTGDTIIDDFLEKSKERGMKHDSSKPQYGLLPMKDLEGVVRVLEFGAKKYAPGDWRYVGMGAGRYFDAALRHLAEMTEGDLNSRDQESTLMHIDHAICSLIFARHFIAQEDDHGGV